MHTPERTSLLSHRIHKRGDDAVKEHSKFLERMVLGADLPGESVPGETLVEIAGQNRVLIENHCGITAYGCREICVKVRFGSLRICGGELELAYMSKQQLIITGRIDSVSLCKGRS